MEDVPLPSRFGKYLLHSRIGRGGMGEVFVATRDGSEETCVLKQLRMELGQEESVLRRLRREARVLSVLNHPNIARILDAGSVEETFYLALELISGHTVRSILHRVSRKTTTRVPPGLAIGVILEVLNGLSYAHERRDEEGRPLNLVHRDLSPNNIMLTFEGEVKIIDFGIAAGKLDDFKTAPGQILGTLRYLSPEQAEAKEIDHKSDLYTAAAVLYEMLTGKSVVPRGKPQKMLADVLNRMPPPPRTLNSEIPQELDDVLKTALQKEAEARFASANAFHDALMAASTAITLWGMRERAQFLQRAFVEKPLAQLEADRTVTEPGMGEGTPTPSHRDETLSEMDSFESEDPTKTAQVVDVAQPSTRSKQKKPRKKLGTKQIGAGLILIALGLVFLILQSRPNPQPETPFEARESPPPRAKAVAVPRPMPAKPPPTIPAKLEKKTRPASPKKTVRHVVPVPPTEKQLVQLKGMMKKLEASPGDRRLLIEVYSAIKSEAKPLPKLKRQSVMIEIDAAMRAGDVELMKRGLRALLKAKQ